MVAAAEGEIDRLTDLARAALAASAFPNQGLADELVERVQQVLTETPNRLVLPIAGEDIMEALGLPPGKAVGKIKQHLQELVMEGRIEPTRAAVLAFLQDHSAQLIVLATEE